MKKFLLSVLAIVMFSLSFVSCSNDDDVASNNTLSLSDKLIGKWVYVKELALDAKENVVSTKYAEDEGPCIFAIFEFKKDGSLQRINSYFNNNTKKCDEELVSGTWSISGNTLKLKIEDEIKTERGFEIKTLTEDIFEMQEPLSESDQDPKSYDPSVVDLKYVFKRQK